MSPLPLLGLSLVRCELFCVYGGSRSHDLRIHKPALSQLSYIHHVVPIKGIEPNDNQDMSPARKPFLSAFAEDIGIEPNTRRYISLSRRTLSPSRFIFRSAHNRTRTYNLRRIRSALSPLSYMSGCADQVGLEPTIS